MKLHPKMINILMADDDPDDRMLMKEALEENNLPNTIDFVEDGSELMDYLYNKGRFLLEKTIRPGLIFLDLNMPKIDGREALRIIKSDPLLRRIPVIVLTTSKAEEDIATTYDLGVNSFISKPARFADLVKVTRDIGHYWFGTVELPKD
ncbi:MAG TPA: response regulator [Cyclobacteriaceae bacterium]|jgi:CheY-like chemotaxis protein|nr:response regulator [Cyclobacteriaceae bacterium]